MALTFTQKSVHEMQLSDLSSKQFMDVALQVSQTLGWTVARKNDMSFTAYTNNGIFNWNAEVQLTITGNAALIISQSHSRRSIEPGKDKLTIRNFINEFDIAKQPPISIETGEVYLGVQSRVA